MRSFEFKIVLCGTGEDEASAWQDATESFFLDPGPVPEGDDIKEITDPCELCDGVLQCKDCPTYAILHE